MIVYNILIGIGVAILLTIMLMSALYMYTGWKSFTLTKHQNFKINDLEPELISNIKFRNCVLTIKANNGETKTFNVESVLNTMIYAYKDNKNPNYKLKLDDPGLSIFSFQLPGFNDKDNKPDVAVWGDDVEGTEVTLTGYYKYIK